MRLPTSQTGVPWTTTIWNKPLSDNRTVNILIGMLMERRSTDAAGAYQLLTDASWEAERRVAQIAADYIAGDLEL